MPEKLTLSDGTVLENSSAIEDEDTYSLYVYTRNDYTLKEIFDPLYDPEKTAEITYTQINGVDIVFTGYTRLIAVRNEGHGLITAVLRK